MTEKELDSLLKNVDSLIEEYDSKKNQYVMIKGIVSSLDLPRRVSTKVF